MTVNLFIVPLRLSFKKMGRNLLRLNMGLKASSVIYSILNRMVKYICTISWMTVGLYRKVIFWRGASGLSRISESQGVWQFRERLKEGGRVEINPILVIALKHLFTKTWETWWQNFWELSAKVCEGPGYFYASFSFSSWSACLRLITQENPKLLSLFIGRNPQDTFRDLDLTFWKIGFDFGG